jgi:hypothetical protein
VKVSRECFEECVDLLSEIMKGIDRSEYRDYITARKVLEISTNIVNTQSGIVVEMEIDFFFFFKKKN